MNSSRLGRNIVLSLLQQAAVMICGLILPRLILNTFGSAYNGVVNSVGQFLSCITLMRAGIGGVTRAALYRALADGNIERVSAIVKATQRFMLKIACIFCVGLVVFAAVYPFFVANEFDWLFTFSLVLILGISTVVQYCFGITNQFLLHADQRLYVYNFWQIIAVILNAILSVILINLGCSIHVVKLGSAAAFSLTPIMLYLYVRKTYGILKHVEPDESTLGQRWDAAAHQLAAFVHSNTDIMVLTILTNLRQVSVYVVYNAIAGGINQVVMAAASAVEAAIGKVVAQENKRELQEKVFSYEWILHVLGTLLFACAAMLIVPFVMVYTEGVTDVDYKQPLLGYIMCLAYWCHIVRLPYQNVLETAGHFKETKHMAIIEAACNIILSCILVAKFGTVGVVLGTVVAMGYRTVSYAVYASRKLLNISVKQFAKRMCVSLLVIAIMFGTYLGMGLDKIYTARITNFVQWIVYAGCTFIVIAIITVGVNCICYPDNPLAKIIKARKQQVAD